MSKLHATLLYKNELHRACLSKLTPYSPWTPTTILIYNIYARYKEFAYYPLREKIHVNYTPTEMCFGMARVAAKGLKLLRDIANPFPESIHSTYEYIESNEAAQEELQKIAVEKIQFPLTSTSRYWTHLDWIRFTLELSSEIPLKDAPLYLNNRRISAILVSSEGELLEWAANTNKINKVEHAEWNLIRKYWNKYRLPLPIGAKIYTSVKPCKMCAGLIWNSSQSPSSLEVYYHQHDNGPKAKLTILNQGSHEQLRSIPISQHKNYEQQISLT